MRVKKALPAAGLPERGVQNVRYEIRDHSVYVPVSPKKAPSPAFTSQRWSLVSPGGSNSSIRPPCPVTCSTSLSPRLIKLKFTDGMTEPWIDPEPLRRLL